MFKERKEVLRSFLQLTESLGNGIPELACGKGVAAKLSARAMLTAVPDRRANSESLSNLGLIEIRHLIRAELQRYVVRKVRSQVQLGQMIGYDNGSPISRILTGKSDLPRPRALLLDSKIAEGQLEPTDSGWHFEDLVDRLNVAIQEDQYKSTDVFLACPMSAAGDAYRTTVRKQGLLLMNALRAQELTVYSAIEAIADTDNFDAYDFAYRANLSHILDSRALVLLIPRVRVKKVKVEPPREPSSVWIELGMALARGIPCTIFTPSDESLPYIVKRAVRDAANGRSVLDVQIYKDLSDPSKWVMNHGKTAILGGASL